MLELDQKTLIKNIKTIAKITFTTQLFSIKYSEFVLFLSKIKRPENSNKILVKLIHAIGRLTEKAANKIIISCKSIFGILIKLIFIVF
jgi:hypothetical protein